MWISMGTGGWSAPKAPTRGGKKPTEKGCPELKVPCSKLEEPNICSAPPLVGDLGKLLGFLKICCKVVRTAA